MNRYLLFAFSKHRPSGGWGDHKGSFDYPDEARLAGEKILAEDERIDAAHLVDAWCGVVLWEDDRDSIAIREELAAVAGRLSSAGRGTSRSR